MLRPTMEAVDADAGTERIRGYRDGRSSGVIRERGFGIKRVDFPID